MADPSTSHQFSVRTKYFFLTYPKCPVDPWELLHYLLTLLHSRVPIYILVTRESHKDGSFHLHTLLQLSNRLETKDSRFFDYQYYHRNCQRAQNCKQVRDYITKPGTVSIAEWGEFYNAKPFSKKTLKRRAPGSDTKDTKMRKIISSSTSKTEYLSMVRQTFPFDWATRLAQFEYSAEKLFPTTVTPYASSVPTDQLRCSEQLSQWATENIKTYTVCEEVYTQTRQNMDYLDVTTAEYLQHVHDLTSRMLQQPPEDIPPYMYADQPEQERQPGQEASGSTTIGTDWWTSPLMTPPHNTML
uniref:Replication-associated protein n=1 Tax=Rice latent virus 1 TaxID=2012856 RepID=A0A2D0WZE4_9GEMI|nr:RepA [Rice latent virus 1]